MYVWEMIACRLRGEGWSVWHAAQQGSLGPYYTVQFQRPGIADYATAPTLTEAYAEAARRAREHYRPISTITAPHFALPVGVA